MSKMNGPRRFNLFGSQDREHTFILAWEFDHYIGEKDREINYYRRYKDGYARLVIENDDLKKELEKIKAGSKTSVPSAGIR